MPTRVRALVVALAITCACLGFGGAATAGEKERYVSGDNYNATQFSAPGLRDTAGGTIKMLIGRDIDASHAADAGDHGQSAAHAATDGADSHGEKAGVPAGTPFHQVQCGGFCRSVSDDAVNESYEACLGPCFKCNQIAIRAQSEHGGPSAESGQAEFEACWARIPELGAF